MRRFICLFLGFFSLFVLLPSMAVSTTSSKTSSKNSNLTDLSKPIIVRSETPAVTFALAANPTTGYSWYVLSYDTHMVVPVGHRYVPSSKNVIGSSGVSYWTFRVRERAFIVPSILKIKMIYGRPWDMTNTTTKVITIVTRHKEQE